MKQYSLSYSPRNRRPASLAWLFALTFLGCGSEDPASPSSETDETSAEARSFEDQVADGATLYGEHCAHCHGEGGEGSANGPPVVGEGALPLDPPAESQFRMGQFITALDIFEFANPSMPADDPGSLSTQEMIDVLAFDLFANGVTLEEPLSADNAESVVVNEE